MINLGFGLNSCTDTLILLAVSNGLGGVAERGDTVTRLTGLQHLQTFKWAIQVCGYYPEITYIQFLVLSSNYFVLDLILNNFEL